MNVALLGRLTRVGFLPVLVASSASMTWMLCHRPGVEFGIQHVLAVIGNVTLMLYGSLLNDLCDRETDKRNPVARKPFAEGLIPRATQAKSIWLSLGLVVGCDLAVLAWVAINLEAQNVLTFGALCISGLFFATIYSLPPIRARRRLFGASWTLMLYHPICWARLVCVSVPFSTLAAFALPFLFVTVYVWAVHGITTISMKDIPDAFADRSAGIRSVPIVLGAWASTILSVAFTATAIAIAVSAYKVGLLHDQFFLLAVPVAAGLCLLAGYLHLWLERASKQSDIRDTPPRRVFHAVAYPATWAILIPGFLMNFRT